MFLSNSIIKSLQFENKNSACADILIQYCLSLPRAKSVNNILIQCMNDIVNNKFEHTGFSNFFKNPELSCNDI